MWNMPSHTIQKYILYRVVCFCSRINGVCIYLLVKSFRSVTMCHFTIVPLCHKPHLHGISFPGGGGLLGKCNRKLSMSGNFSPI